METPITAPRHLADFKDLSLEEMKQNAHEIDMVNMKALGSLTALATITQISLVSILEHPYESYPPVEQPKLIYASMVQSLLERIQSIVDDVNAEYVKIDGKPLLNRY
jgi:hypothetical protein